jgi:hypothetical protein
VELVGEGGRVGHARMIQKGNIVGKREFAERAVGIRRDRRQQP